MKEGKLNKKVWERNFALAEAYYNHYGNLNVPKDFKTLNGIRKNKNGINLYNWVARQEQMCKGNIKCVLPPKYIKKLSKIGVSSKTRDILWNEKFELAKKYFDHYGHLIFPIGFKTLDGINYDPDGYEIGRWVYVQRYTLSGKGNCTLNDEKKEKLKYFGDKLEIGKVWNDTWDEWYELAKKYYEYYNHLDVSINFKTFDGINYDSDGKALGMWLSSQKQLYKNNELSEERIKKLKLIGMCFDYRKLHTPNRRIWNMSYELAKKYYEHYGNLNIPQKFKTKDGITYDPEGFALGKWYSRQRMRVNGTDSENSVKLTKLQIRKLKELEADFDMLDREAMWEEKYEIAKKYYEHYGNLDIPRDFKTKDGITYDSNGVAIGMWIVVQKRGYYGVGGYTMSKERAKKLLEIGMNFDIEKKSLSWEKWYNWILLY